MLVPRLSLLLALSTAVLAVGAAAPSVHGQTAPATTVPATTTPSIPAPDDDADAAPAPAAADPADVLADCEGRYLPVRVAPSMRTAALPVGVATLQGDGTRATFRFRSPGARWTLRATLEGHEDGAVGPIATAGNVPEALAGGRLRVDGKACTVALVRDGGRLDDPDVYFGRGGDDAAAEAAALRDVREDVGDRTVDADLLLYDDSPRPMATARVVTDADLVGRLRSDGPGAVSRFLDAHPETLWVGSLEALRDGDGSRLGDADRTDSGALSFDGDRWTVAVSDPGDDGVRTVQVRVHNRWLIDQILGTPSMTAAARVADRDVSTRADRGTITLFGGAGTDDRLPRQSLSVPIYAGTGVTAEESRSRAGWRRAGPVRTSISSNGAISMATQRPQTQFRLPLWRAESFATYYDARGDRARLWQNWMQAVWYEPPRGADGAPYKLQIAGRADNEWNANEGTWKLGPLALPDEDGGATVDTLTFTPYGVDNPNSPYPALKGVGWPYSPSRGTPVRIGATALVRVEPVGSTAPTSLSISVPYQGEPPGPMTSNLLAGDVPPGVTQLAYGSNPCQRPPTGEQATSADPDKAVRAILYNDLAPGALPTPASDPFAGITPAKEMANAEVRPSPGRTVRRTSDVENADRSVATKVVRLDGETAIACADVRQDSAATECRDRSYRVGRTDIGTYPGADGMCRGMLSQIDGSGSSTSLCPEGSDAYAKHCATSIVTVGQGRLTCPRSYPYNLSYQPKVDQYFHVNLSFLEGGAKKLVKDGLVGAASALASWYTKPSKDGVSDQGRRALEANALKMQREKDARKIADATASIWTRTLDPERVRQMREDLLDGKTPLDVIREVDEDDDDDVNLFAAGLKRRRIGPTANAAGLVENVAGLAANGLTGLAFKALGLADVKFRVRWDPDPYQVATDASGYDDLTDRWGVVYQMQEPEMLDKNGTSAHGAPGTGPDDRGYQEVAVAAWNATGSAYIMCSSTPTGPPPLQ